MTYEQAHMDAVNEGIAIGKVIGNKTASTKPWCPCSKKDYILKDASEQASLSEKEFMALVNINGV